MAKQPTITQVRGYVSDLKDRVDLWRYVNHQHTRIFCGKEAVYLNPKHLDYPRRPKWHRYERSVIPPYVDFINMGEVGKPKYTKLWLADQLK